MTELCEHVEAWWDRRPQATVKALCAARQLPRGTFYAWSQRQRQPHPDRRHQAPGRAPRGYRVTREGTKIPHGQILDWIVEILETDNPQYGYQEITGVLRRRYRLVISFTKSLPPVEAYGLVVAPAATQAAASPPLGAERGGYPAKPAVGDG